jgi:histidyl-tRNA synthetase
MTKPPKLQPVRGMQDMLGENAARFERVVDVFRDVGRRFGFRRVEVPVVEFTQVFARTLGETTDVVAKEMYSFEDRGGESLTLRPEFTAGICRAFISEGWQQYVPLKLMTHGPLFRYERPQKGRYRQFHQVDAEIIGAAEPMADVELLAFADLLLKELGIADGVTLQLNTLGDAETRAAWREALVRHFAAHRDSLSEDSQRRLETNPLRILDSKDPGDRALVAEAPPIDAFLTSDAGDFFEKVQKGLQASGVAFVRNPRLVRGFDYYRHTAFEFVTDRLGAQGTVIGGGRYDGLIEAMGGPPTPAVGWAGGIERLAGLALLPVQREFPVTVVADHPSQIMQVSRVSEKLRKAGIAVSNAYGGSPRKQAEYAKKSGSIAIVYLQENGRIKVSSAPADQAAAQAALAAAFAAEAAMHAAAPDAMKAMLAAGAAARAAGAAAAAEGYGQVASDLETKLMAVLGDIGE